MAERVGAGWVERPVPELALVRAVLLERRRALDPERADHLSRQERPVLPRQVNRDAVLAVRRAALVDARGQARALVVMEPEEDGLPVVRGRCVLERAGEVVLPVVVEANGGGIET